MFFQDATPNTSSYMIAGYTIFFIVMAIYLISFFVRSRNLKQDMSMLESMKQESLTPVKATASKSVSRKATADKVTAGKLAKSKTARPKASPAKKKK